MCIKVKNRAKEAGLSFEEVYKIGKTVLVLPFLAALSLSACGASGRSGKQTAGLTPPSFPAQSAASATGGKDMAGGRKLAMAPDLVKTGDYNTISLKDMKLVDAVGIAIARHPDIGRATAVVMQSKAQIAVEKSVWYPTMTYGVDPGYSRYYGGKARNSSESSIRGTIGARQLLYDFGQSSSRIGVARATYERDRYQLENTVENVAYSMAAIFIELSAAQELVGAAQREYNTMRITRDKIAERVASGLSDAVDLNQADVSIRRAQSDMLSAQTRYDVAAGRFAEIIGVRPDQVASLEITASFIENLGERRNGVDSTPSVLAAEAEVRAAQKKVKLARSQFYPSVNLGVSQQKATGQRNATNDSSFVGVQLNGSFNTGFREKHMIEAARAELNAAQQSSENERLITRTALGSSETEAQGAMARMGNSSEMMSLSLSSRDLYWQQYTLNKRPLTDVVNAERDIFMAESDRITALADYLNARVRAYAAVGDLVERLRKR
ncbi:MAG: Type I secretion system outer membrane protein [Candidatus Tokpelaia hoelldobleri]|uniref:Type I secretion system outer membrane protein n=1 Tax=Candidatus Tokpelaia hoelldobleri TaxID=1902579 RepID=A0A1U9JS50_9HYPH|nr:MAG: Type I secretion system outer membrane protein [Candidatus Tokpelaia hoelldoblerii]